MNLAQYAMLCICTCYKHIWTFCNFVVAQTYLKKIVPASYSVIQNLSNSENIYLKIRKLQLVNSTNHLAILSLSSTTHIAAYSYIATTVSRLCSYQSIQYYCVCVMHVQ